MVLRLLRSVGTDEGSEHGKAFRKLAEFTDMFSTLCACPNVSNQGYSEAVANRKKSMGLNELGFKSDTDACYSVHLP